MSEFISMGGYGVYVWPVYALGLLTLIYNLWSARRRMRVALEKATLNAMRQRNRTRPTQDEDGTTQ
ncbi:MAG: heme exporter protein CcmD [Gammaproteobacteria bacterium]